MGRIKAKKRRSEAQRPAPRHERSPAAARASLVVQAGGGLALLASAALSLALAMEHLGGVKLPGCGPQSPCARAAASVWGALPLIGWPTSYFGVAYFAALLAAWLTCAGRLPAAWRRLAQCGAAGSIVLTIAMLTGGYLCAYCIGVHVANLLFVAWMHFGQPRAALAPGWTVRVAAVPAATFVLTTAGLAGADWTVRRAVAQTAERELAESTRELVSAARVGAAGGGAAEPGGGATNSQEGGVLSHGLTGRWRLGPEVAAIRIVAFFSYQCRHCRALDRQIAGLLRERNDVSLSIRHFPMGKDCNPHITSDPQPNACWAARAAEAAGILRGSDGFWQMHEWLFANEGGFDGPKLRAALEQFGYDPAEFQRVMQSPETLARVREDIDEGMALGLWSTPMIFINGVELRGWNAPDAVRRAVEALAATNPPPRSPDADRPPLALEKLLGDWRAEPRQELTVGEDDYTLGPPDAKVTAVVYGDYRQPASGELYGILKATVEQRGDLRLVYRQFPFNQTCNPTAQRTLYEDACAAAGAAVAAGMVGGPAAFWKMHDWLMEHRADFRETVLPEAAESLGIAREAFAAALRSAEAGQRVRAQAAGGSRLGVNTVPCVFVNGRRLPRWKHGKLVVIEHVIEAAAAEAAGGGSGAGSDGSPDRAGDRDPGG